MMGQDSITRTGARAPGVKQRSLLEWRCSTEQVTPDTVRRVHAAAENTKDGGKPDLATGMLGASLTAARSGKALSDMPALGENPPYGIFGGTMETSASFEARSAPLSYPTAHARPFLLPLTLFSAGGWVANKSPEDHGSTSSEFHVGPHIMIVSPRRNQQELRALSHDGSNGMP